MKALSSPPNVSAAPPATVPLTASVVALALFHALPELLLINIELWAAAIAAIWAIGVQLHVGTVGLAVVAAIIGVPALWVTAQTLRFAIVNRDDL